MCDCLFKRLKKTTNRYFSQYGNLFRLSQLKNIWREREKVLPVRGEIVCHVDPSTWTAQIHKYHIVLWRKLMHYWVGIVMLEAKVMFIFIKKMISLRNEHSEAPNHWAFKDDSSTNKFIEKPILNRYSAIYETKFTFVFKFFRLKKFRHSPDCVHSSTGVKFGMLISCASILCMNLRTKALVLLIDRCKMGK